MAISTHKSTVGLEDILPPTAPYWYSDTEAMAYREGYMQGNTQGAIDMARKMRDRFQKDAGEN